jgi:hypothetical protein
MKNHIAIIALTLLVAGCASNPKQKPVHEQGWIGGRYKWAKDGRGAAGILFGNDYPTIYSFPRSLQPAQPAGVLATRLETNTPAYQAGLREGDLILEAGHKQVTNLPQFWHDIASLPPGSSLPVKAYRDGKTTDFDITVGREKYRWEGSLSIGLPGFWGPLHLVPTPDAPSFSLGPLGWAHGSDVFANLDSVEARYKHECNPKAKIEGDREDWKFWLAILQVNKGQKILAQEPVENPK